MVVCNKDFKRALCSEESFYEPVVVALPVGMVLDRYGPRVCGIISSISIAIGCLFFAFAWQLPFDGYIPGYLFLALGGPFVFISSFQLSNMFPRHSGLILALLTGAFDTSSAIFGSVRNKKVKELTV